jgi:hypothetical protein
MRKLLLMLLLPLALGVVTGCGGSKTYLMYKAAPPAPALNGKVAIEVRDGREPNHGGGQNDVVGAETKAFVPVPTPVRLKAPEDVTGTVAKLLADAAQAAGLGVAAPGASDGTSKIVVEVQRFWCTGYDPVYKVDATLSVIVTDPSGAQVRVPGQPVHGEAAAGRCRGAYQKALSQLFESARAVLGADPVKAAAVAASATGSAAPPNQ